MPKLPAAQGDEDDHEEPADQDATAGADDGAATTDQDKVEKDEVDKEPAEKGPAPPDKATPDQATQQAAESTKEAAEEQGVGTDPAVKTGPTGGGLATAAKPTTEQAAEPTKEVAKEPAVGTDAAEETGPATS